MQEEILKNLIDKFLAGTASPDEVYQLDKWYNSFDAQKEDLYIADTPELKQAVAKGFLILKEKLESKEIATP